MSDAREASVGTAADEHPPSGRRSEQSNGVSDAREASVGSGVGAHPASGRRSGPRDHGSPTRSGGSRRGPTPRRLRRLAPRVGALCLLLVTAAGCTWGDFLRLGMPSPVTKEGGLTLSLWQGSWIAAFCIGALVWGLIIWAVVFHRKRGDDLPPQVRYNLPIEVLYLAVPFIMVSVLYYFTYQDEAQIMSTSKNPDVVVDVTGFQWSWRFHYPQHDATVIGRAGEKPVLVIPKGETVRFNLASPDVVHSFWVPAFLFKMDVVPGHPNHFDIKPTDTGTFAGRCSELCGTNHDRMLFTVRIVNPGEFDAYMARLAKLPQPVGPAQERDIASSLSLPVSAGSQQ